MSLGYAETFIGARKLRNLLVHEYLLDAELFLNALQAADRATQMLMDVVSKMTRHAETVGLNSDSFSMT